MERNKHQPEIPSFFKYIANQRNQDFMGFALGLCDAVMHGEMSEDEAAEIAEIEGGENMLKYFRLNLTTARRARQMAGK